MGRLAYAGFMLLSLAVFMLARRVLPKPKSLQALPPRTRAALALAAFLGGTIGAKLPFALGASAGPFSGDTWISDGKTVTTGLIGGYLAVEIAKWLLAVRIKTGDAFALPLALALAVGRWGCFSFGCCYGTPTELPWGVAFLQPDGRLLRCHPTQIYESAFHLGMAVVLLELMWRRRLIGHRLQLYLIAYGLYRFATEYIRPEPVWCLGLTFYQWSALVLTGGVGLQWLREVRKVKRLPIVRWNDRMGMADSCR